MIANPHDNACRGCKRDLPRAASRCPWCFTPVLPFAAPRPPVHVPPMRW